MDESLEVPASQRFISLGAATLLAGVILHFGAQGGKTRFDQLALGQVNKETFPTVDGHLIHGQDLDKLEPILAGHRERGSKDVVLWLGNSQLHAVNQGGPDSQPASAKLYEQLAGRGIDVITFSQPNANLQEHYVLYELLRRRMNLRLLLLPVVFDDLRNTGVRFGLGDALTDPQVKAELGATKVGGKIKLMQDVLAFNGGEDDLAGVRNTLQGVSEGFLNDWLAEHSSTWESRPELRGRIFLGLYKLRNKAFGISAQTKRKMIPGRYALNMEALAATLESARKAEIQVLMYVVPLRADVETPYVIEEYAQFKEEVEALAANEKCAFANLESLVSSDMWGTVDDIQGGGQGLDFMHFREAGHELLAAALAERAAEILKGEEDAR